MSGIGACLRSGPRTGRGSTRAERIAQRQQAREQWLKGQCPPSSYRGKGKDPHGQRPPCAVPRVLAHTSGKRAVRWVVCKLMRCDWCRPRLVAERVAHYKLCVKWRTTYAHLIDRDVWHKRVCRYARRHGIGWLKFNYGGRLLTVLATEPLPGSDAQPVTVDQLEEWLTWKFEALADGGAAKSSEAWELKNAVKHESGWKDEGVPTLDPEEILQRARQRGWQVADEGVMTPPSEEAWQEFAVEIGLRRPSYHGRRWWADAA